MSNLTKCKICGEMYYYCPNCANTSARRLHACSPEHYQIHHLLSDYRAKVYTQEQAIEKFEKLGITADSNLDVYLPEVAEFIKKILTVEQPIKNDFEEEKTVLRKSRKSKIFKDD